jgi:hypothetical protein
MTIEISDATAAKIRKIGVYLEGFETCAACNIEGQEESCVAPHAAKEGAELRALLDAAALASGDECEPWEHSETPLGAERFAAMVEALQEPRASSKGHRRTIAVCRMLADEVTRLLAEKEGASR